MKKEEDFLKEIQEKKIFELMKCSYKELESRIEKEPEIIEFGHEGQDDYCNLEVIVFYDDKKLKNIRVCVNVDDGGWRAFVPDGDDFIMAPTGKFL